MLRQALCVCKCFSRVSWRSASCPGVTCVGENAGLFSDACACAFGGLSANQRRRNKILSSCVKSQELLPKYTEQERQLTCPEGVCVQAVFQQPELRGMSARARPRVTLRMVLVLFAELFFCFGSQNFPALALA